MRFAPEGLINRAWRDRRGWQTAPVGTATATAIRPAWDQLPAQLRDGLDARLGGITAARTQPGGFTPGLAMRLPPAEGSCLFAKGIPASQVLAGKYRGEAATCRQLPAAAPVSRLRWAGRIAGWIVLISGGIDGRPRHGPGLPHAGRVAAITAGLAAIRAPCLVAAAPPAARELAGLVHGWGALAADPPAGLDAWARRHLTRLAGLETGRLTAAGRDTLPHGGINASNLLISQEQKVWLTGGAQPARGAACPAWTTTPPAVITSYAPAFAGNWARQPPPAPPGVPRLLPCQARAAQAALAWTAHCTSWPWPSTRRLNRAGKRPAARAATRCRRASRGPARRRSVRYPGAGSLRYLAYTPHVPGRRSWA